MKKIVLAGLLLVGSLFANDKISTKEIFNLQPPTSKISCGCFDASFTLYKETKCTGGVVELFRLRCIEYRVKKAFGLDVSEAVYYNNEEAVAYLEKRLLAK